MQSQSKNEMRRKQQTEWEIHIYFKFSSVVPIVNIHKKQTWVKWQEVDHTKAQRHLEPGVEATDLFPWKFEIFMHIQTIRREHTHHLAKTSSSCSTTVFIKCRRPPGTEVHYGIPPWPRHRSRSLMGPTFPSGGLSHLGGSLSRYFETLWSVWCVASGSLNQPITNGIILQRKEGEKEELLKQEWWEEWSRSDGWSGATSSQQLSRAAFPPRTPALGLCLDLELDLFVWQFWQSQTERHCVRYHKYIKKHTQVCSSFTQHAAYLKKRS